MAKAQFGREMGKDGSWKRQKSAFRDWVRADGSTPFTPEPGRYHLYVCAACPWAHRSMIVRRLKGLEYVIDMTIVDPIRDEKGWRFGHDDATTGERDPLHGWTYLSEAYAVSDPSFDGRVTVPTLWDTKLGRIVNNESSDVIRMLNSEFDAVATNSDLDLYPEELRDEIDAINAWVYETINNGVYRCGFAVTQEAYEAAFDDLFASLDRVEGILGERRYLTGDRITEADWRLFTTLVRFDAVYVGHYKCNLRRLVDYPNTWAYARELYAVPGVEETTDFDHIKRHYYVTHDQINPTRIVPKGPTVDWHAPHGRG
ncbi:MAG: glutathione-dependent reductase [Thermoleophilia bacterium]|nr:glutathione-dependent reductase [Thermoleophilia bacterium]